MFKDSTSQTAASLTPTTDAMRTSTYHEAQDGLGHFLSRPIQIASVSWTPLQVSPLSLIIDPWTLFLQNKRVANRLNNYFLLGGNLHVKVMINGNGFYYGRALLDYLPLPSLDDVTEFSTLGIDAAVGASQRLHMYIDPTTSQGGEMIMPMLWPYDRVGLIVGEYADLGKLILRELSGLKHANGATTPVEITYFAWMTDVQLSIPTTANVPGLVPQSSERDESKGSEYGTGPLSLPLSAVSAVAAAAANVPVLAPMAMATSMVAGSLGRLAKAFGYSRPPLLADIRPVRPTAFGICSVTDLSDDVQKLTLTSKQELSIDPRIGGAEAPDEMVIADIATKESWLTSFPWTVGRGQDDCLFSIRATPHLARITSSVYYLSAMCFAAAPFAYWRGTLRVRLSVVASAHHKGRLRIIYDPHFISSTEANVAFNRVVDLETEREITIDVPWSQKRHFLTTRSLGGNGWSSGYFNGAIGTARNDANGVLGVYVLNTLTSPNSTVNNDISVQVFVSMIDLEVATPDTTYTSSLTPVYNYTPQSSEFDEVPVESTDCDLCMVEDDPTPDKYKVYFGERVTSFRQVLKRYVLHSMFSVVTAGVGTQHVVIANSDFPQYRGYTTVPLHATSTGGKYNYVQSTLMSWVVPAYLGMRGGIRSKYHLCSGTSVGHTTMMVSRARPPRTPGVSSTALVDTSNSRLAASMLTSGYGKLMSMGAAMTDPKVQPVLEVEFPYFKNTRFDPAKRVSGDNLVDISPSYCCHTLELVTRAASDAYVERYVSTAEDFQLLYFQGAPPLRALTDPVVA